MRSNNKRRVRDRGRTTRRSPRRTARRSPRRSPRRTARRSPRRSPRRKARRTARISPRRSARRTKVNTSKTRKDISPTKIKLSGLPTIFLINLKRDVEKYRKYDNDVKKGRIKKYEACDGMKLSRANEYYDRLQIMWNAGEKKRKCGAGILNSHMNLIKRIADKKINHVMVIEDDAIVSWDDLKKVPFSKFPQDSMIYLGGTLHPPGSFKDKQWSHSEVIKGFKKGLNTIDPTKYRIFGGHGYYFPRWEHARDMYEIFSKKKKLKLLDTEMTYLQKKGIIKYFYYPSVSYLHIEDAKKGVHAGYMFRDMKKYG